MGQPLCFSHQGLELGQTIALSASYPNGTHSQAKEIRSDYRQSELKPVKMYKYILLKRYQKYEIAAIGMSLINKNLIFILKLKYVQIVAKL